VDKLNLIFVVAFHPSVRYTGGGLRVEGAHWIKTKGLWSKRPTFI